jgi:hypothetical protein
MAFLSTRRQYLHDAALTSAFASPVGSAANVVTGMNAVEENVEIVPLNAALVFAPLAQPFGADFLVARKGGSCQLGSEAVAWFGRGDASSRHLLSPSETTFTDAKAVRLRCA